MALTRETFVDVWLGALQRVARGPLPTLLVLAGEEAFVKERLVEAACRVADGDVEVFSQRPGEGDAMALQRLLDTWATPTLFGQGRLLLVRDADALLKHGRVAALEAALDRGTPPHALLLTVSSLDGRSKLARRLKEQDGLVSLPPLRDAPPPWHQGGAFLETDLNQWIVAEARLQGLTLPLPVADELARRIGNEPGRIASKLDQLAILAEGRTTLTLDDVRAHVAHSSVRLLALWEEHVLFGRAGPALELVDRMMRDGVHDPFGKLVGGPLVLDTVLRGLCTSLARALEAHEQLTPALAAALSSPPWKRSASDKAALDAILGAGGMRVFVERDLRRTREEPVRAAFRRALGALRRQRDGEGASLHVETAHLARIFAAGTQRSRPASAGPRGGSHDSGPARPARGAPRRTRR